MKEGKVITDNGQKFVIKSIIWNTDKPHNPGTYICDLGAEGVSYGFFNGEYWFKLWQGSNPITDRILIYGWIELPIYIESEISQINKQ
jgi:hypothetical protein